MVMHCTQGKTEPCVHKKPTGRVIIVDVTENRNREKGQETEKRKKDEQRKTAI